MTRDDLDTLPDDGHRYELIDGVLVVTPSPSQEHQSMLGELFVLLRGACPAHLKVLLAPFDVALGADTVVQPDILVARRADLTSRDLPTAPVLAVEVLSPSTRRVDMTLKKSRLEAAGCPSYWVVEPAEPRIIAWDLVDGTRSSSEPTCGFADSLRRNALEPTPHVDMREPQSAATMPNRSALADHNAAFAAKAG